MKKRMMVFYGVLSLVALLIIWFISAPQLGSPARGDYKLQLENSPNYNNGKFENILNTPMQSEDASMLNIMKKFMKSEDGQRPSNPLPSVALDLEPYNSFVNNKSVVTWLGHSTLLIRINDYVIITDPVFSERTSPLSFIGTKKFDYQHNYSIEDLPKINAVVISHDHYDHLDYKTIKALKDRVDLFLVPLGIKPHLLRWGVSEEKIVEKNWWDTHKIDQNIKLHCTPSRHFSGRRGFDQNSTLWCSWLIEANDEKIYFSGDSGYGDHFKEIREKFGPIKLAFLECGQYNEAWPYIHMMPEETLKASIDLGSKYMIPIHWGKYKLSLHSWTEPIERLQIAAEGSSYKVLTPKIGESFFLEDDFELKNWWKAEL